jgi:small nuclear ribonucleoprotein E
MAAVTMPSTKVQRIMTQPIVRPRFRLLLAFTLTQAAQNLIFRFLQSKQRIVVWLYENADLRIEGRLIVRPGALCLLSVVAPDRAHPRSRSRSRPRRRTGL